MMEIELHATCPVCGWSKHKLVGRSEFGICPCCGFEYGISDLDPANSFEAWRESWIKSGYQFRYPDGLIPGGWGKAMAEKQMEILAKIHDKPHFEELLKICPVCGWNKLTEPPYNVYGEPTYEICSCCGFEYGYSDSNSGYSFTTWREKWTNGGCKFWSQSKNAPNGWGKEMALKQLENVKLVNYKARI